VGASGEQSPEATRPAKPPQAELILAKIGEDRESALEALRGDLLGFAVGGHFTQVSTRQALHRFYQVVREGLNVPAAWSEVRMAIADLDAKRTQERQQKVAVGVSQNLEVMTQLARGLDVVARKMDMNIGVIANVQRMVLCTASGACLA
jgi:hypothetical protein